MCLGYKPDPNNGNGHKPFTEPGARERPTRDRWYDAEHLKLDLTVDLVKKHVKGTAATSLKLLRPAARIEFDAVDLRVSGVTVGGKKAAFQAHAEKLVVELGKNGADGESFNVVVSYEANPTKGLYFIEPVKDYPKKPRQVWSQGQQEDSKHWLPCYDSPNDKMTWEVNLTVASNCLALSNGKLTKVTDEKGKKQKTFHWKMETPQVTYLLCIAVGEFAEVKETVGGIPLGYYVAKPQAAMLRPTFQETGKVLKFFSDKIGFPYPYPKYDQVVITDFMWGGMENTTITTITDRALVPASFRPYYDSDPLVAHEAAHQWWGDLLTCKNWSHTWLNEGFATYFEALFTEHNLGIDEFRYEMLGNARAYLKEDAEKYRRPIVSTKYDDTSDMFDCHSYQKGACVLHMLRWMLGEESWWKAMKHYAHKHQRQVVETTDLKVAIEEATGIHLDWFFRQWVHSGGHPEFEASWDYDAATKMLSLKVKQTQKTDELTPVFRTPLDVFVQAGKSKMTHRVNIEEAEHNFHFPCDEMPQLVAFDPDTILLKTVKFEKPKEELLFQLEHGPTPMNRAAAAGALGKHAGDPATVEALAAAMKRETFRGVRQEIAGVLGKMGTDNALAVLFASARDADPRVRGAVADALGSFQDEKAAAKLVELSRDRFPQVASAALRNLGKTKSKKALAALTSGLKRDAHNDMLRVAAFTGLKELKDQKAVPLALKSGKAPATVFARNAANTCLAGMYAEIEKEKKGPVRDHFTAALRDPAHQIRRGAMENLGQVDDPKIATALEEAVEREPLNIIARVGRQSLKKMKDKAAAKSDLREMKKEMEAMREENRQLVNRLSKIEERLKKK
ncbi:MAG: aminopeptidase [Planctomycetota bacterium]|nr:MAG: aminopeptidase [Planctomycetota bacterium]